MFGRFEGPKIPGTTESGSVPGAHSEREPSRIGSPSAGKVSAPSGAWQAPVAFELGTFGTAPMSA